MNRIRTPFALEQQRREMERQQEFAGRRTRLAGLPEHRIVADLEARARRLSFFGQAPDVVEDLRELAAYTLEAAERIERGTLVPRPKREAEDADAFAWRRVLDPVRGE